MTVENFYDLPYLVELERDPASGQWGAGHPELPGCVAQGPTREEALDALDEARYAYLEVCLEDDLPVPMPGEKEYSGRVTLRIPQLDHRRLAEEAARQGVSLNSYIALVLRDHLAGRNAESRMLAQLERQEVQVYERLNRLEALLAQGRGVVGY